MRSFGILILEAVAIGQLVDSWPLGPEVVGVLLSPQGHVGGISPPMGLLMPAPPAPWSFPAAPLMSDRRRSSLSSLCPVPASLPSSCPPGPASPPDSAPLHHWPWLQPLCGQPLPPSLSSLPKWLHGPIYMLTIRNLRINSDLSQNSRLTSNSLLGISRWRSN